MTMATTTIRIDIATLPDHLDRSRPAVVAEAIEAALREGGIKADCSDLFSHIKINCRSTNIALAAASCAVGRSILICEKRSEQSALIPVTLSTD